MRLKSTVTTEERPKLSCLFENLCLQYLLISKSGTVYDGAKLKMCALFRTGSVFHCL